MKSSKLSVAADSIMQSNVENYCPQKLFSILLIRLKIIGLLYFEPLKCGKYSVFFSRDSDLTSSNVCPSVSQSIKNQVVEIPKQVPMSVCLLVSPIEIKLQKSLNKYQCPSVRQLVHQKSSCRNPYLYLQPSTAISRNSDSP